MSLFTIDTVVDEDKKLPIGKIGSEQRSEFINLVLEGISQNILSNISSEQLKFWLQNVFDSYKVRLLAPKYLTLF